MTKKPTKTEYEVGEELDLSGLVVTGIYDDQSEAVLPEGAYSVTGFDSETEGVKTVTVSYQGKTAQFTVEVKAQEIPEKTLTGIRIDQKPTKTEYEVGEELDLSGLVVTGICDDQSEVALPEGAYSVTGFDSETEGVKTVTVSCQGKTARFEYKSKPARLADHSRRMARKASHPKLATILCQSFGSCVLWYLYA